MDWPKLIKHARLRLGENQTQFAKRFAVNPNTVCRWEVGSNKLSLEAVEWLLDYSFGKEMSVCPTCGGNGLIVAITGGQSE